MGFDPEAIEIARQTLEGETASRRRALGLEIGRVRSDFIKAGQPQGSGLLNSIADLCAREVENSAVRVWAVVHRCVTDTGVEPDAQLANQLFTAASGLLYRYCVADVESAYNSEVMRSGLSAEVIAGTGFRERVLGASQKLHAEIRLFVRSLRNQAQARGVGPRYEVFNVYAPVGAIQTGAGAQAFINQNLDGNARGKLLEALDQIAADVRNTAALTAVEAGELREAVEETRAELLKRTPNRALLWGKLSAVAAMIKAVPVLEKGYEAIRAVLAAHGVALP